MAATVTHSLSVIGPAECLDRIFRSPYSEILFDARLHCSQRRQVCLFSVGIIYSKEMREKSGLIAHFHDFRVLLDLPELQDFPLIRVNPLIVRVSRN